MGLFYPIIKKIYSNFSSYTHRWTVTDSVIQRNLADLLSAVKSLIICHYKTAHKSFSGVFKLFIHYFCLFHGPNMQWKTADVF